MDLPTQLPSLRLLESPTVHATYRGGPEDGRPKPAFSGVILGETFVNGIAHVDEEHVWPCVDPELAKPRTIGQRTWHLLCEEFGCADITPESQPPRYPLPGLDPYHRPAQVRTLETADLDAISEQELDALTAPAV